MGAENRPSDARSYVTLQVRVYFVVYRFAKRPKATPELLNWALNARSGLSHKIARGS